jgi:hypothetical protein
MDGGVPLATIQKWLGHSNISQTSTYLSGTAQTEHDAMERFEARSKLLVTGGGKARSERPRTAERAARRTRKTGVGCDATIN